MFVVQFIDQLCLQTFTTTNIRVPIFSDRLKHIMKIIHSESLRNMNERDWVEIFLFIFLFMVSNMNAAFDDLTLAGV